VVSHPAEPHDSSGQIVTYPDGGHRNKDLTGTGDDTIYGNNDSDIVIAGPWKRHDLGRAAGLVQQPLHRRQSTQGAAEIWHAAMREMTGFTVGRMTIIWKDRAETTSFAVAPAMTICWAARTSCSGTGAMMSWEVMKAKTSFTARAAAIRSF
jgi:hypothetical protein